MEWQYRNMLIVLTAGSFDGFFRVGAPDDPDTRYHDTLAKAKGDIDDRVAVAAKARHTNLALEVVGDDGDTYVIRGLNRGSGALLGGPDTRVEVYYPTPVIQGLLEETTRLSARQSRIEEILRMVRISASRGGRITAETYDDRIQGLKAQYNAAMLAAEDIVDPPVVTGIRHNEALARTASVCACDDCRDD